jgi:hypothetical protein
MLKHPKHHEFTAVTTLTERPSLRERLARQRAEAALARTPGWLGAGRRWLAFVEPECICCGPDPRRRGG